MEERELICISCPVGCRLRAVMADGEVAEVIGSGCNRGIAYAKQECTAPKRMVTAVIKLKNHATPLSVKTAAPIPKDQIWACMAAIQALSLSAPVRIGQVVCYDVGGTGVDVVATKNVR